MFSHYLVFKRSILACMLCHKADIIVENVASGPSCKLKVNTEKLDHDQTCMRFYPVCVFFHGLHAHHNDSSTNISYDKLEHIKQLICFLAWMQADITSRPPFYIANCV